MFFIETFLFIKAARFPSAILINQIILLSTNIKATMFQVEGSIKATISVIWALLSDFLFASKSTSSSKYFNII